MAAERENRNDSLLQAISAPELSPLFWRSDRVDVESAWYGHVPFAHWIVHALGPRCIVELGVHNGVSYAAFCRAVQREGLAAKCVAVDTWTGDEQTGFYQQDVFAGLRDYHDARFGTFSTLIRRSFDDALELLADGSIDLLHIDGRHGYSEVRHDFDSWRCKLSDRAVVLLHDTNVHEAGFGVWRLWSELRRQFPGFEFLHAHGLGVLVVGAECPPSVAALAGLCDQRTIGALRERFAQLGERCVLQAQVKLLEQQRGEQAVRHQEALVHLRAAETALAMAQSDLETARLAPAGDAADGGGRPIATLSHWHPPPWNAALWISPDWDTAGAKRLADAQAAMERIRRSGFWRATEPVRTGVCRLPPGVQPPVRLALRTVWRLLTPQLNPLRRALAGLTPDGGKALIRPSPGLEPTVCYISGEPDTPGATYRVHRYTATCNAIGVRTMTLHPDELAGHMAQAGRIDVLIIWRAGWTDVLAAFVSAARQAGARIVFDIDDLMIDPALATTEIIDGIRSQNLTEAQVQALYARVQRTMLAADYCTASTFELAGHIRRYGKTCFVLPNGFDAKTLQLSRMAARRRLAAHPDGLLRIGYAAGSRTHQRDFAQIAPVLPRVLRAHPTCRLVLFRTPHAKLIDLGDFPELERLSGQIEWRDLVGLEELPREIARFDVNLAPLQPDNPFCAAKSELKYFEAALAGVCTVASPVGPYVHAIRHGSNGFLAETHAQWETTLSVLLGDPALRRLVAQTALNSVLWAHSPDRRMQLMRRVLREWHGGADAADAFVVELAQRARQPYASPIVPWGEVAFSVDRLQNSEVTVAVPLYNYAHTVIETLETVRAQTLWPLDLVIVDDSSTDRSLPVALEWARANAGRFNRLLVIRNEQNAGLGLTRNAAFSAAETPYVLPLDADNLLRPKCCERLLAALRDSGAAFAYPVIQEFGGRTGLISDAPYDPSRFIGGNYIDAMALIGRSAWSAAGGYAQLRLGWEDYDFWCALAEAGLFGCRVDGPPLAYYRVHETSMLAQVTDAWDAKEQVIAAIERRHPWVTVARPVGRGTPAKAFFPASGRPDPVGADPVPPRGERRPRLPGGGLRADETAAGRL